MIGATRSRNKLSFAALLALFGAATTGAPSRADDVEVVWVDKAPTVRFKPDLRDVNREKYECFCLIVLLGRRTASF